jgi:arylsulfatase A-like enzyme
VALAVALLAGSGARAESGRGAAGAGANRGEGTTAAATTKAATTTTKAAATATTAAAAATTPAAAATTAVAAAQRLPNVLVLTVDALRSDRLSSYGYHRPTSPGIDRLLAAGARFTAARTVEPLTNPALCSLFTSRYPHHHGATRNGLRLRGGLDSLPRVLAHHGYRTAAFVGSWVLVNRISGLGDHFDRYAEVLTRRRWFGMFRGEATAEDLTDAALGWLGERRAGGDTRPFLLWVHYVEPHAPYRLQTAFAARLGVPAHGEVPRSDRYDTEIAFADHHLARLLRAIEADPALRANTLVVFAADHGESLGEHGYWGHGRNLYEQTLRIPLGFAWPRHLRAVTVAAPAEILDVAPTVLGLIGLPVPASFEGFDWTPVLTGAARPPARRVCWFEAHRGAVLMAHGSDSARRAGLLAVGRLEGSRKEVLHTGERQAQVFDLELDPGETGGSGGAAAAGGAWGGAAGGAAAPSPGLAAWLAAVQRGLAAFDRLLPAQPDTDAEHTARLRALGYAE